MFALVLSECCLGLLCAAGLFSLARWAAVLGVGYWVIQGQVLSVFSFLAAF
jgi:type IV secretory pathway TrbD component